MHLLTATTIFTTFASAIPLGSANDPILFTAIALGPSGTNLNAAPISANGKAFWIGKPTTTAGDGGDPLSAVNSENTKNKNTLIFKYVNGEGKLNLDVNIKGGQAVFVDSKTGKLEFTKGYDFSKIPDGGLVSGFLNKGGNVVFGGKGFYACPEPKGSKDVFGVYAESRKKGPDCSGFTFKVQEVKAEFDGGPATAWQYV